MSVSPLMECGPGPAFPGTFPGIAPDAIMQPICSPIDLGAVSPNRNFFLGFLQAFSYRKRWGKYLDSLKTQLDTRGPIPASVWGDPERLRVARRIEAILADVCWGEPLQFHPDDPWRVIGEWEIGDYSEVEAILEIERAFGIELPDEVLGPFLERNPTFGEFVDLVREKRRRADLLRIQGLECESANAESIALSTNPRFLAIIERSRASLREKGAITAEEVRRELGLSDEGEEGKVQGKAGLDPRTP